MTEINVLDEKKEILSFKIELINKRRQSGSLIPLLQSAQDSYGYIPEKIIYYISELTNKPAADIYGVITFYSQFRLKPIGKNLIRICEGTACHVNGAKSVLSVLQEELGISTGCCSLAPVMMINDETFGNLTSDKIKWALKEIGSKQKIKVEA
jgi:NADH-quinone oxidoreductase subunit E